MKVVGCLGLGRIGSRGEHLREPLLERALECGAEKWAGEMSALVLGRQSDFSYSGWVEGTVFPKTRTRRKYVFYSLL